jgi:hypothetical protein
MPTERLTKGRRRRPLIKRTPTTTMRTTTRQKPSLIMSEWMKERLRRAAFAASPV